MDFDDTLTVLWFGLALTNLVCLDWIGMLNTVILWFVFFPIPEGIFRSVLRKEFTLHPGQLWQVQCLAAVPYLVVIGILYFRLSHHYRRKRAARLAQVQ